MDNPGKKVVSPAAPAPTPPNEKLDSSDQVAVAPQWKLIWWRFKKHTLAMISAVVLLLFAFVALFPQFLSTHNPQVTSARDAYRPPQIVSLWDGGLRRPFVYGVEGERNPQSLRLEWVLDEEVRLPLAFFVQGAPYRVFGLVSSDRHLVGTTGDVDFHLLGTDRLGRDVWSRLVYGTRVSLSIGLLAVAFSTVIGILLGGISGYFGGWIDEIIQRLIELLQALPAIPVWLALSAALPRSWGVSQIYLAITLILALVNWTRIGREVRGRFLSLRDEDFVFAARMAGCSRFRVITHHMLPTMTSHIIAVVTLAIPVMIISESSLSFLGLGLRPPAISWGVLLQEAQNLQSVALAPWLLIPGFFIIIAVLAFNLVGDGLRDAADPYSN